jgi:UDP-N-acetylmuramate dehydrogenase
MNVIHEFNLVNHNSFAVSCKAEAFCEVSDAGALLQALDYANENSMPVLILGGGTNVLFSGDYHGLVIHISLPGISIREQDADAVQIKLGAGENWHRIVMQSLEKGFYGLENLALIPGTVGAAPIQNIGAYGVELSDVFVSLEALEVNSGELWSFDKEACRFGYRDSVFKHGRPGELIVTSVTLELNRVPDTRTGYQALQEKLQERGMLENPSPEQVAEAVMAIRKSKLPDPGMLPNCGSFFKNPVISRPAYEEICADYGTVPAFAVPEGPDKVKIPAAWLLEKTGWKGRREGGCGVHTEQAVVLVNYGGASGSELLQLAREMQKTVLDRFGVALEPEVRII